MGGMVDRLRFLLLAIACSIVCAFPAGAASTDKLTAGQIATYQAAFTALEADKWAEARRLGRQGGNPLLQDVVIWFALAGDDQLGSFSDYARLLRDHPDWPRRGALETAAERSMTGMSADKIVAWFGGREPRTLEGAFRLASALITTGQKAQAQAMVKKSWANVDALTIQGEATFVMAFNDMLTPEDHWARVDRLLWNDSRSAANRILPRLSAGHRQVAEARMALRSKAKDVTRKVEAVPAELARDPGLIYERARYRRSQDDLAGMVALFDKPLAGVPRPDLLWRELDSAARHALETKQYKIAYNLAKQHGAKNGTTFAEGEWMAGWIALRFVKDANAAYGHFTAMHGGVSSPLSKARAAYWAGRAATALNKKPDADRWYREASRYPTTYYGQLGAGEIGVDPPLPMPEMPRPTAQEQAAFAQQDMVRVVQLLGQIGQTDAAKTFLTALIEKAPTRGEQRLGVDLAASLGRLDLTLAAAKVARQKGTEMVEYLFPVKKLVNSGTPETALVLGVIRQESAFDPEAVSSAGARGLMQLMPATAKAVAKKIGLKYTKEKLTSDTTFNISLGRAYLSELLDGHGGSYVLAIASYNAGPRRVSEWTARFRDPRRQDVDVIDWVELIPISETRNYVQRVLENTQVYRHRLGSTELAMSLAQDLQR
ncbi:MAG: lytic transglycosylase domain-containing protein [Dongiaceae bacterium]